MLNNLHVYSNLWGVMTINRILIAKMALECYSISTEVACLYNQIYDNYNQQQGNNLRSFQVRKMQMITLS